MAATFEQFEVRLQNADGTETPLDTVTLEVWSVTEAADVGSVTTDASGVVAPASINVSVGDVLRFRVENYDGRAWFIAKTALES